MATAPTPSKSRDVAGVPWLDLPDHLAEKILERLPIFDYVGFGAVCRRWRSIQEAHRLRHAPAPPPMASLPCFIPARPDQEDVPCSFGLSSERRSRRLIHVPLSPRYLEFLCSEEGEEAAEEDDPNPASVSLPYGWLLLDDWPSPRYDRLDFKFTLLNPITGAHIPLPNLEILLGYTDRFKATMSPPPHCDVFVLTADVWGFAVHLFRPGNLCWTPVVYCRNHYKYGKLRDLGIVSAIHYRGKFYCLFLGKGLMVVDADQPFQADGVSGRFIEMDQSQLPKVVMLEGGTEKISLQLFLVESNGKMLLLSYFSKDDWWHTHQIFVRFELFEADLSKRRWVKVESLGDQSLFIYRTFVVSLPAADVGVKENCIYILAPPMDEPTPCRVFDFGTGVVDDTPIEHLPSTHLMFMPSIY